jgi:hypothetical protein
VRHDLLRPERPAAEDITMRTISTTRARLVASLAALAVVTLPVVAAAPAQAALGTCGPEPVVTTFQQATSSVGTDLESALSRLCPGDTLQLPPGTYATGYVRLVKNSIYHGGIRPGTAAKPITVTSQDPANPALIQGGLQFTGADYWRITNLRLQATVANMSALYMNNGVGWTVSGNEMWGARQTNSMANVVIAGSKGQPSGFLFSYNRVHDAAYSTRADTTDHNIYVSFQGATGSGGIITRNTIWNTPHGAAIKLGNGGAYNALGPWGVAVTMNTFVNNGRHLLLHGNVSNNRFWGNLFYHATQRFVSDSRTTGIYIHDVTGTRNTFSYNYGFWATMFTYDPKKRGTYGTTNKQYNDAAHNPTLYSGSGKVFYPNNRLAQPYGAYGTRIW